jgi:hypothetical protein
VALAGFLIVLGVVKLVIVASGHPVKFETAIEFALVVLVPLTAAFVYFLAVFSHGLAGDLAGRPSMYPARLFTLPVSTAALAGWPMLYGTVAMAMLWLSTRLLAVWPADLGIPVLWPALLAASLLAWTQAFTWMPYPLPGLRVIVTMLWFVAIDAIVLVAIELKARELVMLAILSPHVPLAYLVARHAVSRGRRGDVPDWRELPARLARVAGLRRRAPAQFASAEHAQAWFEWRRHGRSLPGLVALLLPFEMGFLFLIRETPALVFNTLLAVLLTPPFMAGFVAATVSGRNPNARDPFGLSPFTATRPLSTAALIAAPLQATIRSTLATWLLVMCAIPIGLYLSDTWTLVMERVRQFHEAVGTPRAVVVVLLMWSTFVVWTWRRLVQSLCIGFTGREWLMKGNVFVTLSLLCIAGLVMATVGLAPLFAALWDGAIWILGVAVCLKMLAAAWIAVRLYDNRLVSERTLVAGAICWSSAVLTLYGVLVWLVDSPLSPRHPLALVAILAIPLARISAAPLALAWNRHR